MEAVKLRASQIYSDRGGEEAMTRLSPSLTLHARPCDIRIQAEAAGQRSGD
jgi:hypothetical protein